MKNWTKILLPLSIILVGIVAGQAILQNKQAKPQKSGYLQTVSGISDSSLDGVEISEKNEKIVLNKENDVWKLGGKKADAGKINQLISIVLNKEGSNYELISQNPSRFDEFSVSSASAKKVVMKSGNVQKFTLFIGGSSYPGTFVRPENGNDVYLTAQSLGELVATDSQSYFDKTVVFLTKDAIKKITTSYGKRGFVLVKENNKWKFENSNKEPNEEKVNELTGNLGNFKADKVLEKTNDKKGYPQNLGSLLVELTDGKTESLNFYKGATDVLIIRKSDGQLFTVSEPIVKNILKQESDLIK